MKYIALTKNREFSRAYRQGKNVVHPHIVLYYLKNKQNKTRVGITCSKKIGGAVQRNRARRVIKHALYEVLPQNAGGYDFVFVARGITPKLKSGQLAATLQRLFLAEGLPTRKSEKT